MLSKKLLDILVCPISHNPLKVATEEIIAFVNLLISKKKCYTISSQNVKITIEEALYDPKTLHLYKVENGIPVLLTNEAINLKDIGYEPPEKNQYP